MIEPADPAQPEARAILRLYMVELVERYSGRPAIDEEVDELLIEYNNEDLRPPTGLLLLAKDGDAVVGCVGLRRLDPETGELTRMFVLPDRRRRGIASLLIVAAEDAARQAGATRMRLDTRKDLVEARALYPRRGYAEIDRYTDDYLYADFWYEKSLL